MSSKWGIKIDNMMIDPTKFTTGDWAILRDIKKDIMRIENIACDEQGLLCAFIAFIYVKSETKNYGLNNETH